MHLQDYFKQFLSNIEPSTRQVDDASASHNSVRDHLAEDPTFSKLLVRTFLAGSYARDTAYSPIQDVDIIVVTTWDGEPSALLAELDKALKRKDKYKTKTDPQRRSIRIDLSHISLDIVPARAHTGVAPLEVPDQTQHEWVATNPEGHTAWVIDRNKDTKQSETDKGRFVPLAKMLKYWKRYALPDLKHPKGFWIETLAGWHQDTDAREWSNVFIGALENIVKKYEVEAAFKIAPTIADPGIEGQSLSTGLTGEDFATFYAALKQALTDAKAARDDTTSYEHSAELWRKVFGKKFPSKAERDAQVKREADALAARAAVGAAGLGARSQHDVREPEQFGGGARGERGRHREERGEG
jgi:hypothetical protein